MRPYVYKRLLFIACCVNLAFLPLGCQQQEDAAEKSDVPRLLKVEVVDIQPQRIDTTLRLVGTLIPIRATTIATEVDGTIKSFPLSDRKIVYEENGKTCSITLGLDLGQKVRKGEIICQIDPADSQLALDVAQASLQLVRGDLANLLAWKRPEEVAQLDAQLDEARATHARAAADLERSKKLLKRQTTSQSIHDEMVMVERTAAAGVRRAEAALALAKAGPTVEQINVGKAHIEAAQAEVARATETLRKTSIRAPYDAVVSDRYVDVGSRVTSMPMVDIMQLIDPRVLLAQVAMPEQYQGMVKLDSVAMVSAAGVSRAVPAVVDLINSMIDPETRTFRVRVTIDNRKDIFKAGGFVNVDIPIVSASGVLAVPQAAITLSNGTPTVFVYKDGCVHRRVVRPGMRNRSYVEIVSGLSPGEQVVTGKTSLLADGLRVAPKRTAAAATQDGRVSQKVSAVQ